MAILKNLLTFVLTLWALMVLYNSFLPPISTLMAARVLMFRHVEQQYVPMSHISQNLVRAVIAAEDARFCEHHGVDWIAMRHVVNDVVVEDDASHGGSTITMQTVKNLFLWMNYSYLRKPIEIPFALALDAAWGKRHVMQSYLNVAEFGQGIFGAEAAALHYFHKPASQLTMREAALLAATLPSPKRRNPGKPTPSVSRYAERIAERALQTSNYCTR